MTVRKTFHFDRIIKDIINGLDHDDSWQILEILINSDKEELKESEILKIWNKEYNILPATKEYFLWTAMKRLEQSGMIDRHETLIGISEDNYPVFEEQGDGRIKVSRFGKTIINALLYPFSTVTD